MLLSEVNWSDVFECRDVDSAWNTFKVKFISVLDTIAPTKQVRLKQRTAKWMNSEILDLIKKRDFFWAKHKKSKDSAVYEGYIRLRNQVRYKTDKAKSHFYIDAIQENQNNPRNLWKIFKDMGAVGSSKAKSCLGLCIDNGMCFDKSKIASHFNSYFTTIASSLVTSLPVSPGRFSLPFIERFYQAKNVSSDMFQLREVSEETVFRRLESLKVGKATGLDNLPARFVRDSASVTCKTLTHIINLSIRHGKFPGAFITARVVPLYKKNCKSDVGNYRPVSILCTISKIFEHIVYEQVEKYVSEHNLIYQFQSGFRPGYSTDTCLIHLMDHIKMQSKDGHYTGMVMLDLQKAFDTVDHLILMSKLRCMGFNESSMKWFKSYLADLKFVMSRVSYLRARR